MDTNIIKFLIVVFILGILAFFIYDQGYLSDLQLTRSPIEERIVGIEPYIPQGYYSKDKFIKVADSMEYKATKISGDTLLLKISYTNVNTCETVPLTIAGKRVCYTVDSSTGVQRYKWVENRIEVILETTENLNSVHLDKIVGSISF
jgi:hypothetical protein